MILLKWPVLMLLGVVFASVLGLGDVFPLFIFVLSTVNSQC